MFSYVAYVQLSEKHPRTSESIYTKEFRDVQAETFQRLDIQVEERPGSGK